MDLSTIDLLTLQTWYTQALANYAAVQNGGKITSASYGQGNGSKSVTYTAATIDSLRPWLATLAAELARRGAMIVRPTRRAIGVRF